jgi:hypothetical protein
MNVIISTDANPPIDEPMNVLVFLGLMMAVVTFAFFLYDLADALRSDAAEVAPERY